MEFRIYNFTVLGLKHPGIKIHGVVSTEAEKVIFKCGTKVIAEQNLEHQKSRLRHFEIETEIPACQSVSLWFYTGEYVCAKRFYTGLPLRFVRRFVDQKPLPEQEMEVRQENENSYSPFVPEEYQTWLAETEAVHEETIQNEGPLISLVIPVYNVEAVYLRDCLDSILNQTYQKFEICIADDCSTNPETIEVLKEYEKKDTRIKVCYRKQNGHISEATNSALEMAEGEYIGLVDNDDVLLEHALQEIVLAIKANPELDFLYTDEDKLDMEGNLETPHFKQDFAPETFLTCNYICHFTVIRRSLVEKIGGFRKPYDGAQDYDLFLRAVDVTDHICHIPKVLYHWRKIPGSTADTTDHKSYAAMAGKRALEDFLERRGVKAEVKQAMATLYRVSYPMDVYPKVRILLFSDGKEGQLEETLGNLISTTNYQEYAITILTPAIPKKKKFLDFYKTYTDIELREQSEIERVIKDSPEEMIVFWNDKCRMVEADGIQQMTEYAARPEIGAVGCIARDCAERTEAGFVLNSRKEVLTVWDEYFMRMTVPVNYMLVGSNVIAVEKSKLDGAEGLSITNGIPQFLFGIQLQMIKKGYRNLLAAPLHHRYLGILPPEYLLTDREKELAEVPDRYYNPNFSDRYAYKLDKKNMEA